MTDNLFKYERPAPDLRIPFRVVPSWNDVISSDSFSKGNSENPYKTDMTSQNIKKWRKNGRTRAAEILKELGKEIVTIKRELRSVDKFGNKKAEFFDGLETPFFTEPVACLIRLWRPTAAAYDVHNLVCKPIIDGFGDVRIFETDAVRGFPELAFTFEGIDPALKLNKEEAQSRKEYLDSYRNRGKNPPRIPLPARIWFDFYRLSRLKYSTIYQFELV